MIKILIRTAKVKLINEDKELETNEFVRGDDVEIQCDSIRMDQGTIFCFIDVALHGNYPNLDDRFNDVRSRLIACINEKAVIDITSPGKKV